MKWHIIAVVLACVLFLSSTMNGARHFSVAERIGSLGTLGEERKESSVGTSHVDGAGNFLLEKAEDLGQKAAVLRKKQNAKSLWAATKLFRESCASLLPATSMTRRQTHIFRSVKSL